MQASALNLHQLATFQVVAKHCSFVRAAEELHFSQPAVSAQIRHLEKSLGVKLFDQIGRKTHLTQAGEELFLYSQKIFSVIDETLEIMEALRSPYYGRLDVGADRDRKTAGDDRAGRLSGDRGRSRHGENRFRLSGDEKAGARDVGGRREVDRPPGAAARANSEPRSRQIRARG